MILEIHNGLGQPLKVPAKRVLICLDDGTPVAMALEYQPGHVRHFRAGDADFAEQLQLHGIDRTVLVTTLDHQTMRPLPRR
jgi:hypothetical protein